MFTGIITDVGRIAAVDQGRDAKRFTVDNGYDADGVAIGASIAHAGCCLTVIQLSPHQGGCRHVVEVSDETLAKTTLGRWSVGDPVNLERALRAGDELGGHMMTGHVDGVGALAAREPVGGSLRLAFAAPQALARFIAAKGSIAVDGVSLTVNAVDAEGFEVNIIPHTAEATTLGRLQPGDPVNLEIDLVARYLARLVDTQPIKGPSEA